MNDEWLKENYEKALLVVAAIVAVALSGWLIFSGLKFGENFAHTSPRPSDEFPETGIESLEAASKALDESVQWQGEDLFVSAPVLEVDGELKPVGDGAVHDPITDEWVKKFDLMMTDADLKDQDQDGDNFTNLEEFLAETSPVDPDDHPAFITKLCLSSMVDSDLQLVFQTQVDPRTWQIDLVSPNGKYRSQNMLVTRGQRFGPDGNKIFRLDGFQEKKGVDANGVPVDESEVTISYVESGGNARVNQVLVREQSWQVPTHEGTFLDRFDGSEFTAKRGGSFKLSNDEANTFTVIEVGASAAILKDQNGKDYKIEPCE